MEVVVNFVNNGINSPGKSIVDVSKNRKKIFGAGGFVNEGNLNEAGRFFDLMNTKGTVDIITVTVGIN